MSVSLSRPELRLVLEAVERVRHEAALARVEAERAAEASEAREELAAQLLDRLRAEAPPL